MQHFYLSLAYGRISLASDPRGGNFGASTIASDNRRVPSLLLEVGAAASGPESYLLVEEGDTDPLSSVRRKGNLYLLACGSQGARLLRGLRDQYYGDPVIGVQIETSAGLLTSLEASASLLAQREAGVSCLAALAAPPNRLTFAGAGDCRVFLQERGSSDLQLLLSPRYSHKKLAMGSQESIDKLQRPLSPGDRVVLCCGPVAQALGPKELVALASWPGDTRPQDIAEELAGLAGKVGGGAVLVLCGIEAPTDLAADYFDNAEAKKAPTTRVESVSASSRQRKKRAPLPWILAVFAAVIIGSAGLDSFGKHISLPDIPLSTDGIASITGTDKEMLLRLEDLWARGQKGDLGAWKEAVDILRALQKAQPAEPAIVEKLRAAELNRQFGEIMGQVAILWGAGETTARTVESWAKIVESLEQLNSLVGGTGFVFPTLEKLYAARVNYGRALEAAGQIAEARATYEKARQLDQSRPEAADALRRLAR